MDERVKNNLSVVPNFLREEVHSVLSFSLWLSFCVYLLRTSKVLPSQGVIATDCEE